MSGLVEGKVALVTGASSGIGRAIAVALAREGAAAVVAADLQETPREGGEPTHQALPCESRFVACDVARPTDLAAAVAAAEEFGPLDIMVNNAGVTIPGDFLQTSEADFDRHMAVNVKGAFFGTQAAAQRMVEHGSGAIVNISSIAGMAGVAGLEAYCASKGAVRLLTYAVAGALGPRGIRINAVHPGSIATQMSLVDFDLASEDAPKAFKIPLGRAGEPTEVADAVAFLCSDLASYINGASLLVDGGSFATL